MNKVILIMAAISCLFFPSCKQQQPPPPSGVPVNLITVKAQTVVYYDRYISTTVALSQVNLLPQVQGYITGIFFKEGAHVNKGEKLYEIDRSIYENNYKTAEANLKVAEGNLKQAQEDADRYEKLNKNKAVAKQIYDHAMITLENAKSEYQSAAESLKTAKTNLDFSIIRAPFNGTIGYSQVKLGDLATVGQTILNTISSDDPMGVDFLIDENKLSYFENIQNDRNHPVDSLFTLLLSEYTIYPYTGKISVIDRSVDPQTGTMRIRLVFPNPKQLLRAGMTPVVRVHNQDSTPQLLIPNEAVVEEMGEYFVYVAKDSVIVNSGEAGSRSTTAKKGHAMFAFENKVKLGAIIAPNVIIKSGIKEGDKIVIEGLQSLHNGSRITP
ncbi:MAG: efflux RND transporter periplasmic adaptor subunit [Ignavibacteriaceae bacterium]|jgi:membrane fusion protein (multidrug efflux system)